VADDRASRAILPLPAPAAIVGEPAHPDAAGVRILSASEVARARGYLDASRAASTCTTYRADWRRFSLWCRGRDAPVCPPRQPWSPSIARALVMSGLVPSSIAWPPLEHRFDQAASKMASTVTVLRRRCILR